MLTYFGTKSGVGELAARNRNWSLFIYCHGDCGMIYSNKKSTNEANAYFLPSVLQNV